MNIDIVNGPEYKKQVPVSTQSDWMQLSTDPSSEDNSGNSVVNPNALSRWDNVLAGTTLMVMLKYDDGLTSITDTVVQIFGRGVSGVKAYGAKDSNSKPICHKLRNSSGNHELTLTTSSSDIHDGTFKYTTPIEVDMDGSSEILIGVKTALAGTGDASTAKILVKVK